MELNKMKAMLKQGFSNVWIGIILAFILLSVNSCVISYKLNGASIDYNKTKTISISDFPNVAELIYPPLAQEFTETLRDTYVKQTRLQVLKKGGDLKIEGEITGYQLTPMGVSANTLAPSTKLTVTVNVRFTNTKNPEDDFEKRYTASQTFNSDRMLNEVEEELVKIIVKEVADNIYNDTVAKW
ncbi:MAG TPA: LptE family protein [Paludibacter sp.]|nr:LptE family protein [Paludibacter sp.]